MVALKLFQHTCGKCIGCDMGRFKTLRFVAKLETAMSCTSSDYSKCKILLIVTY